MSAASCKDGAILLRPVGPSDFELLRSWDTKPHVVAAIGADGLFDWDTELRRRPAWRELLIAEDAGRTVGLLQIIDPAAEETHYWGKIGPGLRAIDIWIGEEADLGRGFGRAMMRLALDRYFTDGSVTAVLVDPLASNTGAHRFYDRLGFERVDRRMFGADDCLVYGLDRRSWRRRSAALTKQQMSRAPSRASVDARHQTS